jgi:hypothetical protein
MGNHFHHHKMSGFEKTLIHDKSDYPVISLIDDLPLEQLTKINDSILYKSDYLKHSCELQREWLKNFMYFWGQKNNTNPRDNPDCLGDFRKSIHPLRYRLWFAVHYPNEVEIREDKGDPELARDFLKQARKEFELLYRKFNQSH